MNDTAVATQVAEETKSEVLKDVIKKINLKIPGTSFKECEDASSTLESELFLKLSVDQLLALYLEDALKDCTKEKIIRAFKAKVKGL